jgi:hypothetical protein
MDDPGFSNVLVRSQVWGKRWWCRVGLSLSGQVCLVPSGKLVLLTVAQNPFELKHFRPWNRLLMLIVVFGVRQSDCSQNCYHDHFCYIVLFQLLKSLTLAPWLMLLVGTWSWLICLDSAHVSQRVPESDISGGMHKVLTDIIRPCHWCVIWTYIMSRLD